MTEGPNGIWPTWAMTAAPASVRVIGVVEVHIRIATTQPPAGHVVTEDGPAQPFVGWLQLLSILADALQPAPAAPLTPPSETAP